MNKGTFLLGYIPTFWFVGGSFSTRMWAGLCVGLATGLIGHFIGKALKKDSN